MYGDYRKLNVLTHSFPTRRSSDLIGVPGRYTTANLLLSLAFPRAKQRQEMVFSAIEDALVHGEIDLGLIIHENRFTYEKKGLQKVMDLGEYWEKETGYPIHLGAIGSASCRDRGCQ